MAADILCLACGEAARWCSEGEKGCGNSHCDHIHCDHCGMHYSLQSDSCLEAETFEELRELMLQAYTAQDNCVEEEVDMNIYAQYGYKVRYIGTSDEQVRWGGCDDPRLVLNEGEVYTVDHTEVHSYHTKVCLVEAVGRFPSVAFREVR